MSRGAGSNSNTPNKGAYSLFIGGTVAAVYQESRHQSNHIYSKEIETEINSNNKANSFTPP